MKNELREFFPNWPEEGTYAVTLTMKQKSCGQELDEIRASQNLRHFLNLLNRACFASAARRYNKKVEVIPALETSGAGRLHYHLTLRNPRPEEALLFEQKIKDCWSKTHFADDEINIKRTIFVAGWNRYITKEKHVNIDWENYHTA